MRVGADPQPVTYLCDQCATEAPARVVLPRGTPDYKQAIQPDGWLTLEGRYSTGEDKSPRLRADLCSAACAHRQINEWMDTDAGD